MNQEAPGFYVPVHRSLTVPMLIAGVPSRFALLLGMFAGIFIGAWHIYMLTPLVGIAYAVAVVVSKRDPYFFDILLQNRNSTRHVP